VTASTTTTETTATTKSLIPQQKRKVLSGLIRPRAPRIKTQSNHISKMLANLPVSTAYYHWPEEGRGARIVDVTDYKRAVELLLHLDFSSLPLAVRSTARWVGEVGMGKAWGQRVLGRMEGGGRSHGRAGHEEGVVNNLLGLVKRKRDGRTDIA